MKKVAKVAKVVKDYLEIGFSMKNVLLFTAFLVAAPLLIGERMRRYERESFKDLLIDYSSTILKQKKDVSIQSQHQILIEKVSKALSCISIDETKVKPFICIQSLLSDNAIDADCSEIKNQLLAINDQYIPSEDELLKRRLENPTDLDILDFTLIFSPNESIAVNHMAELIDKKIERSKAFTQLEQQDSSLKAKYLHDIICSFFVGDSWLNGLFISDITKDQDRLNSDIKSCSSLSDIDKNIAF